MTDGEKKKPDIASWVNRSLVNGHELWDMIPECWAKHPGVTAELAALYEWQDGGLAGDKLVAWYDALARMIDRIRTIYPTRECLKHRQHELPYGWRGQADERRATPAGATS